MHIYHKINNKALVYIYPKTGRKMLS